MVTPEAEARDRHTSKNRLRQLAYHQNLNVRQAVAQNPNTDITELKQLFYLSSVRRPPRPVVG